MANKVLISIVDAERLMKSALVVNGVKQEAAGSVARALVAAEAEGQVGHGFSRLEDYIAQVRSGKLNASAEVSLNHLSETAINVDADFGFAYPALDKVIEAGVPVAREMGAATLSVYNSHHCGALSVQVEKFAQAGLIGLMFANTPKAIAPWGASTPFFGTNPIAFAAPRHNHPPLVIDMSLSKVARGKVMHAKKSGQAIPEGWALDAEGAPTTDPDAALAGSMLPIGGAKGSALVLIVEILAAVLTGGAASHEASSFLSPEGPPPGTGQFMLAIDPGAHPPGFAERLEALLGAMIAQEGARLPGSRRLVAMRRAQENGIEVPSKYLETVKALAAEQR